MDHNFLPVEKVLLVKVEIVFKSGLFLAEKKPISDNDLHLVQKEVFVLLSAILTNLVNLG